MPYKCDQCDYACTYQSALSQHLKRHSDERPFNCNQCNYASSQAVHLTTHLMQHSGDKPKKCNQYCNIAMLICVLTAKCSEDTCVKTHGEDKPKK